MDHKEWLFSNGQPIPQYAYAVLPGTDQVILIKRDEVGYWPVDDMSLEAAEQRNAEIGVTPGVREAMQMGSLRGWDTPWARDLGRYKGVSLVEMAKALKELARERQERLKRDQQNEERSVS
jgi:hypothetical protein